jgi:N-carbamoyl-L-amino-acid hydrolase
MHRRAKSGSATIAGVEIDGDRLVARLEELARIGATGSGGVTRQAWSRDDVVARDLIAGWMAEAGLDVTVDAAANLVARRPGRTDRWLATGSHLDTVVDAGPYDGAYGVVGAVEVAAALRNAEVDHGIIVAAFANEEGARGTSGMTGSHAFVGRLGTVALAQVDDDGVTVAERIRAAGGNPAPAAVAGAAWDPRLLDAFVELHVEQGPVLATAGVPVGVVTGITGRQLLHVTITGAANHAGTTPMDLRADALAAAAEVVLAVEALPGRGFLRVATTGHVVVHPNVRNVIVGTARLGIDLRDIDSARLDGAVAELGRLLAAIAARRPVTIDAAWGQRIAPVAADSVIVDAVRAAASRLSLASLDLPSGAGHDAQILGAAGVPIGMVFVPSVAGVSHSPEEHTEPEHLVAGAQVLLAALVELDRARE